MYKEFISSCAEFIVPFLPEATDKGFAEELVEANATFGAETDSILTYIPAMVVETCQRAKFFLADRIKMATDGLPFQEATLRTSEGTVAAAFRLFDSDAVLHLPPKPAIAMTGRG